MDCCSFKTTCPPPHLQHHALQSFGLLCLEEANIEISGRHDVLHVDCFHLSDTIARWLFEPLALYNIQGKCRSVAHLQSHIRKAEWGATMLLLFCSTSDKKALET